MYKMTMVAAGRAYHSHTISQALWYFVVVNIILLNGQADRRFVNGALDDTAARLEPISAPAPSVAPVSGSVQTPSTVVNSNQGSAVIGVRDRNATTTTNRQSPPKIVLNKCCHFGSHLDATRTCVAGNSDSWVPLIYLINRRSPYPNKGRSPSFMQFRENVLPLTEPSSTQSTNESGRRGDEACETPDELEYFSGNSNIVIFSNGSLFVQKYAQLIEPRNYCVDRESALVCFPSKMTHEPRLTVKKCCGKEGRYDTDAKTCVFTTNGSGNRPQLNLPLNDTAYRMLYGFPDCHESSTSYAILGDWDDAQFDVATGELRVQHKNLSSAEYCLEHFRNTNGNGMGKVKVFTCLHHFTPEAPDNSIAPTNPYSDHLQVAVLNVGLVISVVFLAATLIAGYMMPSVHHVLHWRCQIYYVFCLFIGDFLLAYSQLTQLWQSLEYGSSLCLIVASAMHFFFLAAFFWLNTMCFNIWWTFRDFRPSSLERNQEVLRLRLYSAYAWGIPLLITVIAAFVDHLPESALLQPGFGTRSCWFNGERLSIFAYFFAPIGFLLFLNIILFVSTTHQLTCGLWKRDDVKSTTEKTALGKVCLKLVVVMGVTWIAEIISWLVGGPHSTWFLTDLINALQGVFIFIVVGCQPQVWAACKRFCCPRSRQEITNTTNGVQHSSSSQGLPSMGNCGAEITQNTSINTTVLSSSHTPAKIPMETVC